VCWCGWQLHVAACNGYARVVEFLLAHHAAVDTGDNDDWRPLHCASCWSQVHPRIIYWESRHPAGTQRKIDERPHRSLVTPRGGEWIRPTLIYMLPWAHMSQPPWPPNGISIGSAGLTNVTNRRPRYSVCSNRPLSLPLRCSLKYGQNGKLQSFRNHVNTRRSNKIKSCSWNIKAVNIQLTRSWLSQDHIFGRWFFFHGFSRSPFKSKSFI